MITKTITVSQEIEVTIDDTKFTSEFMQEFRDHMYDFHDVADHMEHLAILYATGVVDEVSSFVEGYGNLDEMGITTSRAGPISTEW